MKLAEMIDQIEKLETSYNATLDKPGHEDLNRRPFFINATTSTKPPAT